jgi:hypothetical protein
MGLRVFQGKHQASRRYENEFFRVFASDLSARFEAKKFVGVLLGHPAAKDSPDFKPDALLITENSLTIVDFKNFKGAVRLPSEETFWTGPWINDTAKGPVQVDGGASKNPFVQLRRQQDRLIEILQRVPTEVPVHLHVLFHGGDVDIRGDIPGKFQSFFSVSGPNDWAEKILDGVNLDSRQRKLHDLEKLLERFEVTPYEKIVPLSTEDLHNKVTLDAVNDAVESIPRLVEEAVERSSSSQASADGAPTREVVEKPKKVTVLKRLSWIAVVGVILVAFFVGGVLIFGPKPQDTVSKMAGIDCIQITELADFKAAKGVCVTFRVGYIRDSGKYVFLQDQSYGKFTALVVSNSILSEATARLTYLDKEVEVRGDITEYEGTPQIKVFDISQLTLSE